MLVIEAWNGYCWKLVGRMKPGARHTVLDHNRGVLLHLVIEPERTTVRATTEPYEVLLELGPADEPWERLLRANWMPESMLCRLHHQKQKIHTPPA
jgi:hypothetical protein